MASTSIYRPTIDALSDCALIVCFGPEINPLIHQHVLSLQQKLQDSELPGLIETVPAFTSLTLHYDPWRMKQLGINNPHQQLSEVITDILNGPLIEKSLPGKILEVPVLYGGEEGPDLPWVAEQAGLTSDEVIHLHSSREYLVYMIGFLPGFPYLGGMDERIRCPRKNTPRLQVAAGSVGIAGMQTGIYPLDTPGGWQIIGRTSVKLFDPDRLRPALLMPGDRVKFLPMSRYES